MEIFKISGEERESQKQNEDTEQSKLLLKKIWLVY